MHYSNALEPIVTATPVIPVLIIEDLASAVPLARALVAGGLYVLEITLRTSAAHDAVTAIASDVEGAVVGVGTVFHPNQLELAESLGARFAVSPGFTPTLLEAARDSPLPLLPGAVTAAEMMTLEEAGYNILKFFPAEAAGGVRALKAFASPLPAIRFCPTGGITAENAPDYLALPNVVCVGGSWVAPADAVAAGDWTRIERLAREAASLPVARPPTGHIG
jgi:2-dehydro-3-deoxyphosphogluconate aldolase / (4S)-4-hydroxy-2-oxoglutarate aldolase